MTLERALVLLKERREGTSLSRLAERFGVAKSTVLRWTRGEAEPEGLQRERLLAWADETDRGGPPGSTMPHTADPVDTVVAEGQRELARWAREFAAKLLDASAQRVRSVELPEELRGDELSELARAAAEATLQGLPAPGPSASASAPLLRRRRGQG